MAWACARKSSHLVGSSSLALSACPILGLNAFYSSTFPALAPNFDMLSNLSNSFKNLSIGLLLCLIVRMLACALLLFILMEKWCLIASSNCFHATLCILSLASISMAQFDLGPPPILERTAGIL